MIQVLGCIFQQHDLRLVVVAAGLCALACATALSMISRARATTARTRTTWLAGAGAVAGCGIWGTHFVAMLAYHAGLPIAFAPGLTILSAIIAHTGWHWMIDRGEVLRQFEFHWPAMDAIFWLTVVRWLMVTVTLSGLLWLAVTLSRRWGGKFSSLRW